MKQNDDLPLFFGYLLGIVHLATKEDVLFYLSVAATSLAIVNYILQIKKNRSK